MQSDFTCNPGPMNKISGIHLDLLALSHVFVLGDGVRDNDGFEAGAVDPEKITNVSVLGRRGGGHVLGVLAFFSDNPILNTVDDYSFCGKFVFEKTENKPKRGWLWRIF